MTARRPRRGRRPRPGDVDWDGLVLAIGAEPRRLAGSDGGAHVLRTAGRRRPAAVGARARRPRRGRRRRLDRRRGRDRRRRPRLRGHRPGGRRRPARGRAGPEAGARTAAWYAEAGVALRTGTRGRRASTPAASRWPAPAGWTRTWSWRRSASGRGLDWLAGSGIDVDPVSGGVLVDEPARTSLRRRRSRSATAPPAGRRGPGAGCAPALGRRAPGAGRSRPRRCSGEPGGLRPGPVRLVGAVRPVRAVGRLADRRPARAVARRPGRRHRLGRRLAARTAAWSGCSRWTGRATLPGPQGDRAGSAVDPAGCRPRRPPSRPPDAAAGGGRLPGRTPTAPAAVAGAGRPPAGGMARLVA